MVSGDLACGFGFGPVAEATGYANDAPAGLGPAASGKGGQRWPGAWVLEDGGGVAGGIDVGYGLWQRLCSGVGDELAGDGGGSD